MHAVAVFTMFFKAPRALRRGNNYRRIITPVRPRAFRLGRPVHGNQRFFERCGKMQRARIRAYIKGAVLNKCRKFP